MSVSIEEPATAGKFLTFDLGDEHYGLPIMRVQEIVGLLPVTRVPRLPSFVAGVVNLRGRIIPVVDLRQAFGMESADATERTCIVIVAVERESGSATMGAIVDQVSEVVDLPAESVEETPEFGANTDTSFISGVGRLEDRVVLLLDIDKALSGSDLELVASAAEAAAGDRVDE